MLKPGANDVRAMVWAALAGDGTSEGVQYRSLATVVRVTVTERPDGTYTATPIDVTIALPDTGLDAADPRGGLVPPGWPGHAADDRRRQRRRQRQARRGACSSPPPSRAARSSSSTASPGARRPTEGVHERHRRTVRVVVISIDSVLATPVPTVKRPVTLLRTTKFKRSGKRVSLALAVPHATCKGAVTLKYAAGTLARKTSFSLGAGGRLTLEPTLTVGGAGARWSTRSSLLVQVKLTTERWQDRVEEVEAGVKRAFPGRPSAPRC